MLDPRNLIYYAFVAQLDRALLSEGKGCWFESNQMHHYAIVMYMYALPSGC